MVAFVKALLQHNMARRVLFVADRIMLADQALNDGFHLISNEFSAVRITSSNVRQHKHASIHIVVLDTLKNIYRDIFSTFSKRFFYNNFMNHEEIRKSTVILDCLHDIEVRPINRDERYQWDELIRHYRYLGLHSLIGECIRSLKQAEDPKERLSQIPDPRMPRGKRHRKLSVLTVAICALLCSASNYAAIAQWAKSCTQNMLKRLGCRFNRKTGNLCMAYLAARKMSLLTEGWKYNQTGNDNQREYIKEIFLLFLGIFLHTELPFFIQSFSNMTCVLF